MKGERRNGSVLTIDTFLYTGADGCGEVTPIQGLGRSGFGTLGEPAEIDPFAQKGPTARRIPALGIAQGFVCFSARKGNRYPPRQIAANTRESVNSEDPLLVLETAIVEVLQRIMEILNPPPPPPEPPKRQMGFHTRRDDDTGRSTEGRKR